MRRFLHASLTRLTSRSYVRVRETILCVAELHSGQRGKNERQRPLFLSLSLSRPLRSTPILALRSWGKCSREPRNSARFLLLDSRAGRKTVPPAPRPIPHKAARPQRQPIRLPLVSKGAESQWEVAARAELLFVAPAPSLPPSAFHSAPGGGSEIRGPM